MIIATNKGIDRLVERLIGNVPAKGMDSIQRLWLEKHSTLSVKNQCDSYSYEPSSPLILPDEHYIEDFRLLLPEKRDPDCTRFANLFICGPYPLPDRVILTKNFEEMAKSIAVERATVKHKLDENGRLIPLMIEGDDCKPRAYIRSQIFADKERILYQAIRVFYYVNHSKEPVRLPSIESNYGVENIEMGYIHNLSEVFADYPEVYENIFRMIVSLDSDRLGHSIAYNIFGNIVYQPSAKVVICGDEETLKRVRTFDKERDSHHGKDH